MNKAALVQAIIDSLSAELDSYTKSARAAHAEATHEQSKAENKYDTRGLEAAYLARGQSKQALEIVQARQQFAELEMREFGPDAPIDLGALIEINDMGERAWYFIGPRAGGTEILHEGASVIVITPQSPLGRQLIGKKQGERLQFEGGRKRDCRILSVQ